MFPLLLACSAPTEDAAFSLPLSPLPEVPSPESEPGVAFTAAGVDPAPRAGLVYEIYVRSFQDSDGDGIGDLNGVRSRLDHVRSLGADTIWLMPLFPSVGPAGYDTLDYDTVRSDYGTEEDLDALVDAAHARGMRVIVDLPLNHVARTHPWFMRAEADPADPERELFVFADTQWDTYRWFPAAGGAFFYAFFGDTLPDLNWKNERTRERMLPVFDAWLDRADGYRLDAVAPLVETLAQGIMDTDATHALLAELRARADALAPDAFLLGEASDSEVARSVAYLGSDGSPECHGVIDFPRRAALLQSVSSGDPTPLLDVLLEQQAAGAIDRMAPYVQSHDLPRLAETEPDPRVRRLLQVVELTLPGTPILYYGEELDLPDTTTVRGQDYAWRAPMPWDDTENAGFSEGDPWMDPDPRYADGANVAAQAADPASMLNLVRGLACVRERLVGTSWSPIETDAPNVLAYERAGHDGRILVLANLSSAPVSVEPEVHGAFLDLTKDRAWVVADAPEVQLAPYEYRVFAEELGLSCRVPAQAP